MRHRPQTLSLPTALILLWMLLGTFPGAGAVHGQCAGVEVAVSGLDFGRIDPLESHASDGAGYLVVRCHDTEDTSASYQVTIDGGTSDSPSHRVLTGPAGDIEYGLFLDPARTIPWGDEASGEALEGFLGVGEKESRYTIYGRIQGHSQVSPGTYTDQLTLTVYF